MEESGGDAEAWWLNLKTLGGESLFSVHLGVMISRRFVLFTYLIHVVLLV